MDIIHVNASVEYDVIIGKGLLGQAGNIIKKAADAQQTVIVSDDNVFPLYGKILKNSLETQGMESCEFVFPHGENSKCMSVYEQLLEFMGEHHLTRGDILIALGGGVAGDLGGFAAATYQRGIKYAQIPTTLLAAVDSSVGGKTAVNLKSGKNQAGCFYQPCVVICDISTLNTLPEKEFTNGCAEVIKYGMIMDAAFLRRLEEEDIHCFLSQAIARCVQMKRDVVSRDEFDTGERMLLNFGHTLGHGVEKCSGFKVPHGYAVAIGMAQITGSAEAKGICREGTYDMLVRILEKYHLPVTMDYPAADIVRAASADKKSTGKKLRIIVPEEAGRCVIREIAAEDLGMWIPDSHKER